MRRYVAAFASRNPQFFSGSLLYKAFTLESDEVTKSWLAMALGHLGYYDAKSAIDAWVGEIELADENKRWGIIGRNLLDTQFSSGQTIRKINSTDPVIATLGFINTYHLVEKDITTLSAIHNGLTSNDDHKIEWALVVLSNTKNFKKWNIVFDLLHNSDNPKIREWSAWAISSLKSYKNTKKIIKIIESESDPRVREWLYKAIATNKDYETNFIAEAFSAETDYMIQDGLADLLFNNESKLSHNKLKKLSINFIYNVKEISTPEHEILISKLLQVFRISPLTPENIEGLLNLISKSSKQLKFSICGILSEQLKLDYLADIVDSDVFRKIGLILSQESIILRELRDWNSIVQQYTPTIMSEELFQSIDGYKQNTGIIQRATIFHPGGEAHLRISQNIENVTTTGAIIQELKTK